MSAFRPYQVALFTGPSDRDRWALNPQQQAFLHTLGVAQEALVLSNFPYRPDSPPYRPVPLFKASINNGIAYMRSRQPRFRETYFPHVERMLAGAEQTFFVTGSCGLELFNNLSLPTGLLDRISLFAYGPVARRRPLCRHLVVSGRQDLLSRWCFPAPDRTVESTHLAYLSNQTLQSLCASFITDGIRPRYAMDASP